jgi:hypothetical protein
MRWKRIVLGITFALVVIAMGFGLYFIFFRSAPPPPAPSTLPTTPIPTQPPTLPPTTGLPPSGVAPIRPSTTPSTQELDEVVPLGPPRVAAGGVTLAPALTDSFVEAVTMSRSGRPQYYDPFDEQFYRLDANGNAIALSDRRFPSVQNVAWAPDDARAIIEFPDGANVLYNFATDQQVTLPRHWEAFSFSPDSESIAGLSIGLDRENRFLFEASSDGSDFTALEPLGDNARLVQVAWSPNDQVVAFSDTGPTIGDSRKVILAVGRHGENFPGIIVEGLDFRPTWSPSGKNILYSSVHQSNDYKPELWIVAGTGDDMGSNRRRLRVNTWADKCAFSDDDTVYCAVPETLQRGAGLEPVVADATPDTIERIDLRTGIRKIVGRPNKDMAIGTLRVAPDRSAIYFTSKQDGRLHEMRLK